jgi:hypothetical protein
MIKFLAQLFRGLHYIVGISAPPPGTSDRTFALAWLGGIASIAAFFVILVTPALVDFPSSSLIETNRDSCT